MLLKPSTAHGIEVLEQRIAPAAAIAPLGTDWKQATFGANLLHAGQGLTTGNGNGSGNYLVYDQAGDAIVFITDLNNNSKVDANEVTGISAGDGLQLISFVDIHGDIVTNLTASDTLSDSDHNPANNDPALGGDGLVLLNSTIASITLRSVRASDFPVNSTTDLDGNGVVDASYVQARLAPSSYSIFGNILAGKGFGVGGTGLTIDTTGTNLQSALYGAGNITGNYYVASEPSIGSILTGTKAGGQFFSFGATNKSSDIEGTLASFVPPTGQNGGDILGVTATTIGTKFTINSLETGDGGIGARGGNIANVQLNGDVGGYKILTGDGGRGPVGGAGGSITGFSDLGSTTGYVLIETGNGGLGATGAGGAGGTASFGTLNLAAGLHIILGSGGDGFTAGGNGASLPVATVTTPDGGIPYGVSVVGTMHANGGIGSEAAVDFNGDGVGDLVYASTSPDQLVVVLGSPNPVQGNQFEWGVNSDGTPIYHEIFLDGVASGTIAVGDFNDDGHPDIAVASADLGSSGGVTVFLNQFDSTNTQFEGFSLGHTSPLPALTSFEGGGTSNPTLLYSPNAIASIVTGDFNGDGHTDVAVMATYYMFDGAANQPVQVLMTLTDDVINGKGVGAFYADFGVKGSNNPLTPYAVVNMSSTGALPGSVVLHSTALVDGNATDALMIGVVGGKSVDTYSSASGVLSKVGTFSLGVVDTVRDLATATAPNVTTEEATLLDFTVLDFASPSTPGTDPLVAGPMDGVADVAVITPDGYLITLAGSSTGSAVGSPISDPHASSTQAGTAHQNSGIYFGAPSTTGGGFNLGTTLVGVKTTDADGDGNSNEVAVLNYSDPTSGFAYAYRVHEVSLTSGGADNGLGTVLNTYGSPVNNVGRDTTIVAWDDYYHDTSSNLHLYAVTEPNQYANANGFHRIDLVGNTPNKIISSSVQLVDNSVDITAGDGGDGLVGKGGQGGSLGNGSLKTSASVGAIGGINITFPLNKAFNATSILTAGDGGNGFSSGGDGGSVSGVVVRYDPAATVLSSVVEIYAGDGGFGVSSAGGAGGSIMNNSINTGDIFIAGNGGRGATGGAGGSVLGNKLSAVYDTSNPYVAVEAGNGGAGASKGGAGGDVSGFHGLYIGIVSGGPGTMAMYYTAGNGGAAVSGAGGKGGSILNTTPLPQVNAMGGEIYYQAGDGGQGATGGAGGSISNFADQPSTTDVPSIVSFLAGNGGAGTSGAGGAGGSITSVTTPSAGSPNISRGIISGYTFDRVIAGNGGIGPGGAGGAGGSITGVNIGSNDGGIVMAAGAGGAGLATGGVGGSVTNSTAILSANTSVKVLVIAGVGGDAYAFIQNPLDNPPLATQKPFGGKVGKGGNGGSIVGFTESADLLANVDLIAGNGGSTVNYGTITDMVSYVGKGGSINNATIAGNIGSGHAANMTDPSLESGGALTALGVAANVPIKSYTDTDDDGHEDETISAFVQQNFRIPVGVGGAPELNDDLGNVGAVVGAAGKIKVSQSSPGIYTALPARGGVNGSFTNVTARNLMSAVAGSVDQIAAIQTLSGVKIGSGSGVNFIPGVVGSDKDPTLFTVPVPDPTPGNNQDYLDENGQGVTEPAINGRLIDGAVVATNITSVLAGRVFRR